MKNNLNRRDFFRIGGLGSLAMVTLPSIQVFGHIGEDEIVTSEGEYGGFYIRRHAIGDPPYQEDNSVYKRFNSRNTAFGRLTWDKEAQKTLLSKMRPAEDWIRDNTPGYRKEDFALNNAAWTVANFAEANAGVHAMHKGLLSIAPQYPVEGPLMYDAPWDRSHMSDEDIAVMIKKAAKLYGASLVGITQLDKRWIYTDSYDFSSEGGPIVFEEVKEMELPEGQVSATEGRRLISEKMEIMGDNELKDFIMATLATMPSGKIASGGPAGAIMKVMPASQYKKMLPMVLGQMPSQVLNVFADKLELGVEISDMAPSGRPKPRYLEDNTLVIPETMNRVIVMAFEMDYDTIERYPTPIGAAGAGNGYSRMVFTSSCLAEFIRTLGYNAIPCANNTGLSVPMAIDAGLGQLGRQGILITPKYGPRVRLAKVITDMPMSIDRPISFGVTEFCDVCGKCAKECPGQAISKEPRTNKARTISNTNGVMRWPLDPIKCLSVWLSLGGSDCGTCILSCPFNKIDGWLHEVTRELIGVRSGNVDKLLLKMDDASGYGKSENPDSYWKTDRNIHIK